MTTMRVLAARFRDRYAASAVRDRLVRGRRDDAPGVDIAPLGVPGNPESSDTVLAGQFPDEEAAAVAELLRECGGEIVANVDETWTRPRVVTYQPTWGSNMNRARVHA